MEDTVVQHIWCKIGASSWQGNDEKTSIADIGCWKKETVQYIDFHSH